MALDTGKDLAVVRIDVTGSALVPFVLMRSGEDGEELRIVFAEFALLSGRVTLIAIHAVEAVTRNALVFGIHAGLIVLMAFNAGEDFPVVRIDVTGPALVPFVFMLARKNGEKLGVVFAEFGFLSGRMALVAVQTVEAVSRDPLML